VNGSVRVSTTGLARGVDRERVGVRRDGRANWNNELEFSTVNGGIPWFFRKLDTEIRATTVNGDIETDWPLTFPGASVTAGCAARSARAGGS